MSQLLFFCRLGRGGARASATSGKQEKGCFAPLPPFSLEGAKKKTKTQKTKTHPPFLSPFFVFPPPPSTTGLLNIQYCVQEEDVYIIEANPRASRTVPFVAKAVGHPLAAYASLLMSGMTLKEVGFESEPVLRHVAVKEAVLPFEKFAGADTLLGPEMKSTGEVMGIDVDFGKAYAKAAIAAGSRLPPAGSTVFITMTDKYKDAIVPAARQLVEIGYKVVATSGTAAALRAGGVECADVLKIQEGRPNAADLMRNGEIDMMFITSTGDEPDVRDGKDLRRLALSLKVRRSFFPFFFRSRPFSPFPRSPSKKKKRQKPTCVSFPSLSLKKKLKNRRFQVPVTTTVAGARATVQALAGMKDGPLRQVPIQDYFPETAKAGIKFV